MKIDNKNILISIVALVIVLSSVLFVQNSYAQVNLSDANSTDQQKFIENNSRIQNLEDRIESGGLSNSELTDAENEIDVLKQENDVLRTKLGGTSQGQNVSGTGTTRYGGLVKCDGVVDTVVDPKTGKRTEVKNGQVKCDFSALIFGIKSILKWMFGIGVSITIFLIAWAGLLYMTGIPKNITKAKSILPTVAKGFIIMLVAWLVVYYILGEIVSNEFMGVSKTLLKGDF